MSVEFSHDDGELVETTLPSGPNLCYTYDDCGSQASRYTVPGASTCATGARSDLETFTSDPLSGITGAQEGSSGAQVTVTYDPLNPGRVSHVTESTGTQTSYTYDSQTGQLTSTIDAVGAVSDTTSYGYDSTSGLVDAVTDP